VLIELFWFRHLRSQVVVRGDNSQLLEQLEAIRNAPALDQPTVGDPPDKEGSHATAPAGGTTATIVTRVGTAHAQERRHAIILSDQIKNLHVEVGERLPQHLDATTDRAGTCRSVEDDRIMDDDVTRDELVDNVEVASVEPLLVESADELFVGHGGVSHRAIIFWRERTCKITLSARSS
jgi:hypothetical protein